MLDADLLQALTAGNSFVHSVHHHHRTASTQDHARMLAEQGAPEGTVVFASRQDTGRGSRGRTWHSPRDAGIYMSLIVRPAGKPTNHPRWTLLAAAAVCQSFQDAGAQANIKWPNDIQIKGRKSGGILAECRSPARNTALVLGLGLNINHLDDDFPPELQGQATSLRLELGGPALSLEQTAARVLERFSILATLMYHEGWAPVRTIWSQMTPGENNQAVLVRCPVTGQPRKGMTTGVDETGALLVCFEDGTRTALHSSESLLPLES
jgi:BirA family biotin operon repressor/biotin-[acetyl-CoA-carboxylase] ligase